MSTAWLLSHTNAIHVKKLFTFNLSGALKLKLDNSTLGGDKEGMVLFSCSCFCATCLECHALLRSLSKVNKSVYLLTLIQGWTECDQHGAADQECDQHTGAADQECDQHGGCRPGV